MSPIKLQEFQAVANTLGSLYCHKCHMLHAKQHGEIKLVLYWKLYPSWIAFVMLKGALYATVGEKESSGSHGSSPS